MEDVLAVYTKKGAERTAEIKTHAAIWLRAVPQVTCTTPAPAAVPPAGARHLFEFCTIS